MPTKTNTPTRPTAALFAILLRRRFGSSYGLAHSIPLSKPMLNRKILRSWLTKLTGVSPSKLSDGYRLRNAHTTLGFNFIP